MTRPGHDSASADAQPGFLEHEDPAATGDHLSADDSPQNFLGDDEPAAAPAPEAPAPPERRLRVRRSADRQATSGGTGVALGVTTILAGLALGIAQHFVGGDNLNRLGTFGINATTMVTLGAVMAGTALVRRHVSRALSRLDAVIAHQDETAEVVQNDLQFLVEAQNAQTQRPPAAGEELPRVMMAMQRQDEKLNNITKALKMYGKPLMEISNQGADAVAAVAAQKTHFDGLLESSRQGFQRLETGLRNAMCKKEIDDLLGKVEELRQQSGTELRAFAERMPRTEQLQQQLVRVEAAVQTLAQRGDDVELRKSLVRLEDATQRATEQRGKLAQGESVQAAAQRLEQRLDATAQKLTGGLDALRQGNLGALETTLRDIQREVAGVATSVAQIQSAVKNGAFKAAPTAAAPTPAPAATPAPTSPAPAPAAGDAPAAAVSDAQAGAQQNATGTRATSGKNVLGAIAKLKQMKN